ncbi:MAG: hypothetical protein EU540_04370 [Promethearchaeota archaeon]|nr:MAG: hypothetical protein EU540_04370 [Candidatus Lokiarchaeota archaeon]
MSSENIDSPPKTGFEKILEFINNELETNHPITITEIVDKTGFSWSFVKKTLKRLKKEEYSGYNFEKSGATWIIWKDREIIIKKMDDTCSRFLK